MKTRWMGAGVLVAVVVSGATARAQTNFAPPTPEELAMSSVPGYPGGRRWC